jgi:uncharacterized protein (DUF2267 family)
MGVPYPSEYQRATSQFSDFLTDVRDGALYGSPHQAYTTAQGVLRTFRRRLSLPEAIRFAAILPVGLRALFVADWDPDEPRLPFASRAEMSQEVRALRADHNFSDGESIHVVAVALRQHVDQAKLDAVLATLPEGAVDFWAV